MNPHFSARRKAKTVAVYRCAVASYRDWCMRWLVFVHTSEVDDLLLEWKNMSDITLYMLSRWVRLRISFQVQSTSCVGLGK